MLWTTDLLLSIYCPIMQCLQYRLSRWHLLNHDCPVRGKRIKEDSVLFSVISHIIRWKSNITNQSVRMLVCGFWWKSEWFYNTFTTWTMEYGRMYHHVNFAELHQAGGRSIITRTHFHKVTLLTFLCQSHAFACLRFWMFSITRWMLTLLIMRTKTDVFLQLVLLGLCTNIHYIERLKPCFNTKLLFGWCSTSVIP